MRAPRQQLSHVYWMLLIISAVSSALLFLIVASENVQNSKLIGPDKNQAYGQDDNVSVIKNSKITLESEDQEKSNIKVSSSLKTKVKDQNLEDIQTLSSSFDNSNKNEGSQILEEIELEILKESLSQQPNLSQGISNGDQVLFTLDTVAAASLQSLSSDRTEFRPKYEGNASSGGGVVDAEELDTDSLLRLAKLSEANATNYTSAGQQPEVQVVVVRAEQKRPSSIREEMIEEQRDKARDSPVTETERIDAEDGSAEKQQLPKSPTAAPELNDSAARARLTSEESTAAIIDSFVTAGPSEPHEDMPSFNEWAQKRLVEEAEKKKTHPNASVQTANGVPSRGLGGVRMRSKNYASPDCGAKVVSATPESTNVGNILISSRDEYMLNACTNRVWFVVELCEPIQANRIELANFELFSSSPKDLSVYVSDRFPTRDWTIVGQFTARDTREKRDVQSFELEPRLFGKFIKVELHSHYGTEHFCPISLFRAYGTSEFEVLETETESDGHTENRRSEINAGGHIAAGSDAESEDDEDIAYVSEEPSPNISSNPFFTVIRLMRKAAEMLIRSADFRPAVNNITKIQESISGDVLRDINLNDCGTPLYNIACRDCDDERFGRVFQLVSCKRHYLESLVSSPFIQATLAKSHLCGSSFGFDILHKSQDYANEDKAPTSSDARYYFQARLLSSFFTPDYIIALCNVLAAREQRLFANTSHQEQRAAERTPNKTRSEQSVPLPLQPGSTTGKEERSAAATAELPTSSAEAKLDTTSPTKSQIDPPTDTINLSESLVTQIKPTKTSTTIDDAKVQSFAPHLESSKHQTSDESITRQSESIPAESSPSTASKRHTSQKLPVDHQEGLPSQKQDISFSSTSTTSASTATSKLAQSGTESAVSDKIEGSGIEPEVKIEDKDLKHKIESEKIKEKTEQEQVKPSTQDQMNFEGFDFKDLEVDSTPSNVQTNANLQTNGNTNKNDATAQQNIANPVTPQQKESVFLRLSNRIKALERNMSLSSQYLEELSRRYKKQVEEMQRSLERAVTAMHEESRKGEERENKRVEEVATLHDQINGLNKLLDELVTERNSWWRVFSLSAIAQHSIFVFIDVILVILILTYCKRSEDDDVEFFDEKEEGKIEQIDRRNKTYEIVKQKCNQLTKKTKKRRPSEIASQVSTGTYDQLMIEDSANSNQLSRRDKKKRRKRETTISRTMSVKETGSRTDLNSLPSRSASASEALCLLERSRRSISLTNLEYQRQARPDSAPDNCIAYFGSSQQSQQPVLDKRVQVLAMNLDRSDTTKGDEGLKNSAEDENISPATEDDVFEPERSRYSSLRKKLSSPSFMKTALGSRSKRISFSGASGKKQFQSLDENAIKSSERQFDAKIDSFSELDTTNGISEDAVAGSSQATNGIVEESDESRSSTATPTYKKKKTSGLKKMVRKLF